jgi:hypothetical protein
MCLPVSRLFWVSSLAYPNLLGTKGYVVVVVVDHYFIYLTTWLWADRALVSTSYDRCMPTLDDWCMDSDGVSPKQGWSLRYNKKRKEDVDSTDRDNTVDIQMPNNGL